MDLEQKAEKAEDDGDLETARPLEGDRGEKPRRHIFC
jgi:hypothetical protein